MKEQVTQERLKQLLRYEAETGEFTWLKFRGGTARAGSKAGSVNGQGYIQICIDDRLYLAHRLAWLFTYGEFPPQDVDHADGVRDNNAIANLRAATRGENHQNRRKLPSRTGITGVVRAGETGKFKARIKVNGALILLGSFDTGDEAGAAYLAAKRLLHKFQPTPRWSDGAHDPIPYTVTEAGRAALGKP